MKYFSITFFLLSFTSICLNARTYYKSPMVEHAKEYLMQQIKQGADPASIHKQIKELEAIDRLFLPQSFSSTDNINVNIVQKLDSIIYANGINNAYYKYDIEHQRLSSYIIKWGEKSYGEFTLIYDNKNRQTGLEYVSHNGDQISGSLLEYDNDDSKNIYRSTSHSWEGTPDNIVSLSTGESRYNSNNVLIYQLSETLYYNDRRSSSYKYESYYYDNGNLKTRIWYYPDENGTWVQSSKEEYFTDGTYNFYERYGLRESRYLNKYRNTLTTDYYGLSENGKHYLSKREIECRRGDKICFQNKELASRTEYKYNEDGSVQEGKMEEFNNNEYGTCIYKWDKNVNDWRLSEQVAAGGFYTWIEKIEEGSFRSIYYHEPGYNIKGSQIFHDGRWFPFYVFGYEYEIEWIGSYSEDEGSAIISSNPIRSFTITTDQEKWITYCSESITTLNSQRLPFQTIDYNNGVIYQQTFYSYNSDNETTEVNTYAIDGASMKLSKRVVYDYDYSANMSEVLGLPESPYCVSQMTRFKNKPLSIKTYDGDGNLISTDEWFYSDIDETEGLPQNWYDDPDDSGDVFYNLQGQRLQNAVPEQIIINNKQQKVYTKQ